MPRINFSRRFEDMNSSKEISDALFEVMTSSIPIFKEFIEKSRNEYSDEFADESDSEYPRMTLNRDEIEILKHGIQLLELK